METGSCTPKVKHMLITKYAPPKVFSIYDNPYGIKRTITLSEGANNCIRKISHQRVVSAIAGSTSGYADGDGAWQNSIIRRGWE